MKIVFMGTPDFARAALEALIEAGHEITAVVTQPDKAKGRSKEPVASPVKVCACSHGIPVLQPRRIKKPEEVDKLRQYPAELYVVAAFGQILSREILDIPPYGCLNIHASLLPKYRGTSPIQHVILDGEEKTGIAILGGQAITEALSLLEEGKLIPEKQQEEQSCYAPLIEKEMGEIDFTQGAMAVDRRIRGLTPWPSAYTSYRGRQLKIWRAKPVYAADTFAGTPGEILKVEKDCITVAAGEGVLCIYELQLEGRKRMSAHDFLLGVRMEPGEKLGE